MRGTLWDGVALMRLMLELTSELVSSVARGPEADNHLLMAGRVDLKTVAAER
jgi:hypothetical protein